MDKEKHRDYRMVALDKLGLKVTDANGLVTFSDTNDLQLVSAGIQTWNIRLLFGGEAGKLTLLKASDSGGVNQPETIYYCNGEFIDDDRFKEKAIAMAREKNEKEKELFLEKHDLLLFIDQNTTVETPKGLITVCNISLFNKTAYETDPDAKALFRVGYNHNYALITEPEVSFPRWKDSGEEDVEADFVISYKKQGEVHKVVVVEDVLGCESNRKKYKISIDTTAPVIPDFILRQINPKKGNKFQI